MFGQISHVPNCFYLNVCKLKNMDIQAILEKQKKNSNLQKMLLFIGDSHKYCHKTTNAE